MEYVLVLSCIGMALIGGPVAYALALSASLVLVAHMDLPQVLIVDTMFSGIDSFKLLAVPFFMLAVAFMSAGGLTKRLVGVAQAMVGVGVTMCFTGWSIAGRQRTLSPIHLLKTIKEAFWAMMTPVIVIGGIYGGVFTLTEAMAVAAVYSIVVGLFVHKELKLSDFPTVVFKAVIGTILIIFLAGAARMCGWLITSLQLPPDVGDAVIAFTRSPILFLLIMNVLLLALTCHGSLPPI